MALLYSPQQAETVADRESPTSTLYGIPDGAGGIRATLDMMVLFTRQYRSDITLRTLAETIIGGIPGKDYIGEIQSVQDWVRDNIRYTKDIYDTETLKTPLYLIQHPFGDCDDMALLAGTLLNALGHKVRYVAVGTDAPGEFNHVFPETVINNGRWISVETTESVPLGWRPETITAQMIGNV